jgi:hypothetical protein
VHNTVQVSELDSGRSKGSTAVRILDNYSKHFNTWYVVCFRILGFKCTVWYVLVCVEGSMCLLAIWHSFRDLMDKNGCVGSRLLLQCS